MIRNRGKCGNRHRDFPDSTTTVGKIERTNERKNEWTNKRISEYIVCFFFSGRFTIERYCDTQQTSDDYGDAEKTCFTYTWRGVTRTGCECLTDSCNFAVSSLRFQWSRFWASPSESLFLPTSNEPCLSTFQSAFRRRIILDSRLAVRVRYFCNVLYYLWLISWSSLNRTRSLQTEALMLDGNFLSLTKFELIILREAIHTILQWYHLFTLWTKLPSHIWR